jgi:hypothetical protein
MDMCITSEEDSDHAREISPHFNGNKSEEYTEESKDSLSQDNDKNRSLQKCIEHVQIALDTLID